MARLLERANCQDGTVRQTVTPRLEAVYFQWSAQIARVVLERAEHDPLHLQPQAWTQQVRGISWSPAHRKHKIQLSFHLAASPEGRCIVCMTKRQR
jgi:hypothetical protein